MAIAGSGLLVASHRGTVVHTGSNPGDPRNSTRKRKQQEAG
jgi:hypothetical protein